MMGIEKTDTGRQLNRLFRLGTVTGMTDPQLLEQFVAGDADSAGMAFEAIVERHGPLVLRICRSTLHDSHAAEDAFQATFLVLARKALTIESRDLLGNWLYGVALRTARKAKAAGIPVFYYLPPQLWAWAPWRVRRMRKFVDHILCGLPFEPDWYAKRGLSAESLRASRSLFTAVLRL